MTDANVHMPQWTPPRSLNVAMTIMLKTPGLQRWIGRSVALVEFTGRRSGRRYVTPISYARTGSRVSAVTKRRRTWWRNFADCPVVRLRLAGRWHAARASARAGDPALLPDLVEFLEARPRDARAYGLRPRSDGSLPEAEVRALLDEVVLLGFRLDPPA